MTTDFSSHNNWTAKQYIDQKVLCASSRFIVTYSRGKLCFLDVPSKHLLYQQSLTSKLAKFPLLARFLRNEPRCAVLENENICLISHQGRILRYNFADNSLTVEHTYKKGMRNPLNLSVIDTALHKQNVYYGEYTSNPDKGPVAIYKREDNQWNKIYEFAPHTIKHIHNIVYDAYRNIFYILTGDSDTESGIWWADASFKKVYPLCVGKQEYRSCMALPTQEGILYATDTPLGQNWLIKISLDGTTVRDIKKLHKLPGPCIYSTRMNQYHLFSTSVEPDSSLPKWQYYLTRKTAKEVDGVYSHVFLLDPTGKITHVFQGKKDRYPMGLFQFGTYQFPYNNTNNIFLIPQALYDEHGKTLIFDKPNLESKMV